MSMNLANCYTNVGICSSNPGLLLCDPGYGLPVPFPADRTEKDEIGADIVEVVVQEIRLSISHVAGEEDSPTSTIGCPISTL